MPYFFVWLHQVGKKCPTCFYMRTMGPDEPKWVPKQSGTRCCIFSIWSQHFSKDAHHHCNENFCAQKDRTCQHKLAQKIDQDALFFSFDPNMFFTAVHQDFVCNSWAQMGQNRFGKKMTQGRINSNLAWIA